MSFFGWDQRPIRLSVFGKTDTGQKRSDNQDNFLFADLTATEASELRLNPEAPFPYPPRTLEVTLGPKGALAVVADGMGGAAAGGLASSLAVSWIHGELLARWGTDRLETPQQFALRLREAVEAANIRIHEAAQQNPLNQGMGTTVTAVGILDSFLYLAQVGDSRAYLVRSGEIRQLTRDQSLVQQLVDTGTLTEEEAEQSGHANVILQALGVEPTVRVDLSYQEVRRGDLLIVCSDGLTRTVRKDELAAVAERIPNPAGLCNELVELANARGAPDNITVLALRVDGEGLEEPRATDVIGHQHYAITD